MTGRPVSANSMNSGTVHNATNNVLQVNFTTTILVGVFPVRLTRYGILKVNTATTNVLQGRFTRISQTHASGAQAINSGTVTAASAVCTRITQETGSVLIAVQLARFSTDLHARSAFLTRATILALKLVRITVAQDITTVQNEDASVAVYTTDLMDTLASVILHRGGTEQAARMSALSVLTTLPRDVSLVNPTNGWT